MKINVWLSWSGVDGQGEEVERGNRDSEGSGINVLTRRRATLRRKHLLEKAGHRG
jgi:hypothetical protein